MSQNSQIPSTLPCKCRTSAAANSNRPGGRSHSNFVFILKIWKLEDPEGAYKGYKGGLGKDCMENALETSMSFLLS